MEHGSRYFECEIKIYFNGDTQSPTIFKKSDIEQFSFDCDSNVESQKPFGQSALKTLEISLNNELRDFTFTNKDSIYYGKLLAGTKVECSVSLELSADVFETVPIGTFYTGDWDVSSDSNFATVTCYDRLYTFYETDTPKVCVIRDTNIGELFEALFLALGIPATDFIIDAAVYDVKVLFGWLPESKVKATIEALCTAGACTAIVQRDNKILVASAFRDRFTSARLRNSEQIISVSQPQSLYKAYAGVTIEYMPTHVESEIASVASTSEMQLIIGENKIDSLSFSGNPVWHVVSIEVIDTIAHTLIPKSIGATSIDATIVSTVASTTASISVSGYYLKQASLKVTKNRTSGVVPVIKDKRLSISSPLIQSAAVAEDYADIVLAIATDPSIYLTANIMGDISIDVLDKVLISPDSKATQMIPVVVTRMTFTFNGGLSSAIECTKAETLERYLWAYVGPGFYTKSLKPKE